MKPIKAYGTQTKDTDLEPLTIERRELSESDVKIDIIYCGVCHSDIHTARSEWGPAKYPVVPGHEIIGKISAMGEQVTKYNIGDLVGVGCLVDSCKKCSSCKDHLEQYCETGATFTYNSPDPYLSTHTFGGYSENIVVNQEFVLRIPLNLDASRVAPLLCAGITTWSPLRHWNIKKGDKVGIIGLGGLGHMGIKFARALGAHVVMITRSNNKAPDAEALGAHEVLISTNESQMQQHTNSFDFLLNTIPVNHNVNPYLGLMKRDTTMVMVGAVEPISNIHAGMLISKRKHIAGSMIGGIKETQEMLDFCGEHNVLSDVEIISIQDINQAWERVVHADVKYRFVIDMKSLK
ncbi:MAG: NAD(P)-dependent alcohol dehydrogenase [Aestuariibaculum sp.]